MLSFAIFCKRIMLPLQIITLIEEALEFNDILEKILTVFEKAVIKWLATKLCELKRPKIERFWLWVKGKIKRLR